MRFASGAETTGMGLAIQPLGVNGVFALGNPFAARTTWQKSTIIVNGKKIDAPAGGGSPLDLIRQVAAKAGIPPESSSERSSRRRRKRRCAV